MVDPLTLSPKKGRRPARAPTGAPPSREDMLDLLTIVGLEPPEADAYLALLLAGASKASDFATQTRIDRAEAYRRLQGLVRRGFARSTLGRPVKFEAVTLRELFAELRTVQSQRLELMSQVESEVGRGLASLRVAEPPSETHPGLRTLQGRTTIIEHYRKMLAEAEKTMVTCVTHEAAATLGQLGGLMATAVERGRGALALRALLRDLPAARSILVSLPKAPSLEFRALDTTDVMAFALQDGREALLWLAVDASPRLTSPGDVALVTNAAPVVHLLAQAFEALWSRAKPFA